MSEVHIYGTLILKGDLTSDGDITVHPSGKVIPISNAVNETFYFCPSNDFISGNGKSSCMVSTQGDIIVDGTIDGDSRGFPANFGPGANSTLLDNFGDPIPIYGATHAGLGAVTSIGGSIFDFYEEFVLTGLDIDNRRVQLEAVPLGYNTIFVNVVKGTSQQPFTDFEISGRNLSWAGLSLELDLAQGDQLRVTYTGDTQRFFPPPRPTYGSYEAPTSIGSGSGEVAGGGGIKLQARSGTVTIDGVITMDGGNGTTSNSGGGSGGSVWVCAWNVAGTGSISADGGTATYAFAGGGGGGYVTLCHESSNTFSGTMTVSGNTGGQDGIIYLTTVKPFFWEKFTGDILNEKWWEIKDEPVEIQNEIIMDTTEGDLRTPALESLFRVSGRNIAVDMDWNPVGPEPGFFTTSFLLWADENNWVGIGRRAGQFIGMYSVDGFPAQTGITADYSSATFRILKSDTTFTFQYYDATSTPQTIFSDTIPELADRNFFVRMQTERDSTSDMTRVEYYTLTSLDISNQYITLAGPPQDESNVALNIVGGSAQFFGLDYYVDGLQVKWDASSLPIIQPMFMYVLEHNVLDSTDIANKWIELSEKPYDQMIAVNVVGGATQVYGPDFYVLGNKLVWADRVLEDFLEVGDELVIQYTWSSFDELALENLLSKGDILRVMYLGDPSFNALQANWDNFKVFDGILAGHETQEPLVYVDPVRGSDSSEGLQLSPLQNLFVATAWAKRGGTVVLYDGTHNPTEIMQKNLTIRGTNGGQPVITSVNVQDSTGSNWENSALTFRDCQGLVKNVKIVDTTEAILAEGARNLEIRESEISDSSVGIHFKNVSMSCKVLQNTIHDTTVGVLFEQRALNPYIYSNAFYDSSVAVIGNDATNMIVSSNTIDDITTGVVYDNTSSGYVASNNLTNLGTGIIISADSSPVYSYNNNFFGTTTDYNGTPVDTSGNISSDPQYVGKPNYVLQSTSPDIDAGTDDYDQFFLDRSGATRTPGSEYDIGAYEFIDTSAPAGETYVSSTGDDYWNSGGINDPFRTLDKAMLEAQASIIVDGGHYDSYYLELKSRNIGLNTLTVFTATSDFVVSYFTLDDNDASNKFVSIPGFIPGQGLALSNIAVNPLGGAAQEFGADYTVILGAVSWDGLGMDGFLQEGDTLRVMYTLGVKALNTMTLDSHFSNLNPDQAIWVSPSGSDSSDLGGDGTNSGGNGTFSLPYRTVEKALQDSTTGDNIFVLSGEYPMFDGSDSRVLVPLVDRTGIPDPQGRYYLQDLFEYKNFFNHNVTPSLWDMTWSGDSTVTNQDGYMSFSFDGTNETRSDSEFSFTPNWEVSADVRNAIDPLYMKISNGSNEFILEYDNGDWTSNITTGGETFSCWGHMDEVDPAIEEVFFTDYICITSSNVTDGFVPLSFIPEDTSDVALNVVGGPPQELGEDFIINDARVFWGGLGLEEGITPGEILRVMYRARGLSDPMRIEASITGDVLMVRGNNFDRWEVLMKKQLTGDTTSAWDVSFYMDTPNPGESHDNINGRGFVSKFLAIARTFSGTGEVEELKTKTQRRPVVFYNNGI